MTPLLSQVVSEVLPAVVAIRTPAGIGSGFFISENGLILTNAHVVGSFFKATVVGRGGALEHGVTADVIAVDDEVDLAVISISSDVKRHFLEFADSDALALADDVVVIGYPLSEILGEAITVTKGIVSSKREVDGLEWLQTDAAVNPGNSGGPLVNVEGEVVGIVTLRVEGSPAGRRLEGTGFALSASVIKKRLPGLTGMRHAHTNGAHRDGLTRSTAGRHPRLVFSQEWGLGREGLDEFEDDLTRAVKEWQRLIRLVKLEGVRACSATPLPHALTGCPRHR